MSYRCDTCGHEISDVQFNDIFHSSYSNQARWDCHRFRFEEMDTNCSGQYLRIEETGGDGDTVAIDSDGQGSESIDWDSVEWDDPIPAGQISSDEADLTLNTSENQLQCFIDDRQTGSSANIPLRSRFVVALYNNGTNIFPYLCQTDNNGLLFYVVRTGHQPVRTDPRFSSTEGFYSEDNIRITFLITLAAGRPTSEFSLVPFNFYVNNEQVDPERFSFFIFPNPDSPDLTFNMGNRPPCAEAQRQEGEVPYKVLIPINFPNWIKQLLYRKEDLERLIDRHSVILSKIIQSKGILGHARYLVYHRHLGRWITGSRDQSGSENAQVGYRNFLYRIMNSMDAYADQRFNRAYRNYEAAIARPADYLWEILQSSGLDSAYTEYYGENGEGSFEDLLNGESGERIQQVDGETRDILRDSYILLSRTNLADTVYSSHLQPWVRPSSRFRDGYNDAKWVNKLGGLVLDIYTAFLGRSNRRILFEHPEDILSVSEEMERLGYMQNTARLRDNLSRLRNHQQAMRPRRIRLRRGESNFFDEYFTNRIPRGGAASIGAVKSLFSVLALYYTLTDSTSSTRTFAIRDVETARDVLSLGNDLMSIPQFSAQTARLIPGELTFLSYAARTTNIASKCIDYGLALNTFYQASETADGIEFTCDFVIVAGKALTLCGAGFSLTGNPAGPVLVLIGGSLDLLGEAVLAIHSSESEGDKFNRIMSYIDDIENGSRIGTYWGSRGSRQQVRGVSRSEGGIYARFRSLWEMDAVDFVGSRFDNTTPIERWNWFNESSVGSLIEYYFNEYDIPTETLDHVRL